MSDTICEQLDSVYGVFHSAILKCKVTRNSDCESSFNEISCGVSLHCCTSWLNLFIVTCKKVLIGCKWWSMECFQLSKHGTDWDKESICCCDEWIGGWAPFSTLFSYTNHKIKQLHNEMSLYPQKQFLQQENAQILTCFLTHEIDHLYINYDIIFGLIAWKYHEWISGQHTVITKAHIREMTMVNNIM